MKTSTTRQRFTDRPIFALCCALSVSSFVGLSSSRAEAAPPGADSPICPSVSSEVIIGKAVATASSWANLRSHDNSIKVLAKKLISDADAHKKTPPAELTCPKGCRPSAAILFRSVPNKLLTDYGDRELCSQFLAQTERTPFTFPTRTFTSVDEIQGWFSDFSQGSGEDGRELYKRCSGSCSPVYSNTIKTSGSGYSLVPEVVCGHARDKDDNTFTLSSAIRFSCEPEPKD